MQEEQLDRIVGPEQLEAAAGERTRIDLGARRQRSTALGEAVDRMPEASVTGAPRGERRLVVARDEHAAAAARTRSARRWPSSKTVGSGLLQCLAQQLEAPGDAPGLGRRVRLRCAPGQHRRTPRRPRCAAPRDRRRPRLPPSPVGGPPCGRAPVTTRPAPHRRRTRCGRAAASGDSAQPVATLASRTPTRTASSSSQLPLGGTERRAAGARAERLGECGEHDQDVAPDTTSRPSGRCATPGPSTGRARRRSRCRGARAGACARRPRRRRPARSTLFSIGSRCSAATAISRPSASSPATSARWLVRWRAKRASSPSSCTMRSASCSA